MRTSPSIVPGIDRDVFLVLDDFGRMGCANHANHRPRQAKLSFKRRDCCPHRFAAAASDQFALVVNLTGAAPIGALRLIELPIRAFSLGSR
jgi:hypothetical protein